MGTGGAGAGAGNCASRNGGVVFVGCGILDTVVGVIILMAF
jgi:hypothetical protein